MSTGSALDDLIKKARDKRKAEEDKQKQQSSALRGDRDDKTRTASAPVHQQDNNHGIGYGSQPSHPTAAPTQHADWYKPIFKDRPSSSDNNHGIGYGSQTQQPQTPKWKSEGFKPSDTRERDRGPSSPLSQDNNHGIGYGSQLNRPMGPQPGPSVGPQIPTWRSDTNPAAIQSNNRGIGYGSQLNKPVGPQPSQPSGPMVPAWKAPSAPSFGDRETLDSDTPSYSSQVGLSVPRVSTGPTQIGALSSQPAPTTVNTPSIQPWRPDWDLRDQADKQAGAFGGQRDVTQPTTTQPGLSSLYQPPTANIDASTNTSVWRKAADVIGTGVPMGAGLIGNWVKDKLSGETDPNQTTMGYPVSVPGIREAGDKIRNEMFGSGDTYYNQLMEQQAKENQPGFQMGDIGRALSQGAAWLDKYTTRPVFNTTIPGTSALFGDDVSAGQILQSANAGAAAQDAQTAQARKDQKAAGTAYNLGIFTWDPQTAKDTWHNTAETIMHPLAALTNNAFVQGFQSNIQQSIDVRKAVEALPPEQKAAGNMALYNLISGPQAVQKTLDGILNKDSQIATLNQKAQEAQASGDAVAAAQYGKQIKDLRNQTAVDVVNAQQDPWMEIAGGVMLDPTNLLPIGELFDAYKAYKQTKTFGLTAEQGVKQLDTAAAAAEALLKDVQPGTITDIRPWFQKMWNPMARTAETRSAMSTNTLWQTATQLLGNTADKGEARKIIEMWVDNPQALITQGVETAAGQMTPGAGVVANKYVTEQMPILKVAAEKLKNLASLAGDGAYVPADVASEVEKVIYDASRSLFGLKPMELPAGATSFKLVKDGVTGKIQYLDKAGKVVSETVDVLANAQATYNELRNSVKAAKGSGLMKGVDLVTGFQKGILNDMFLSRPAYWIKNATSATATLAVDGNYSWKKTPEITSWWAKKLGEGFMPNLRTQAEVVGDAAKQNWTRAFWPKANPYASTMEFMQSMPATITKLLGGGVPLTEEKLYLNAMDTAGQRAFRRSWGEALNTIISPAMKELGIGDDVAQHMVQSMLAAGVDGSRQDVMAAAQALASGKTLPFTLEHLGVAPETLSLDGWKQLNQIFTEGIPEQAEEAARMVSNIIHDETTRYGATLLSDPPQPVVYEWTQQALAQDGAEIMDSITNAAKRAGGDQAAAAEQAKGVVQQFTEAVNQGWETFRNDLAQAPNASPDVAIDVYHQYNDILRQTREAADKLAQSAIKAPTEQKAAAWAEHQAGVAKLWQDASQKLNEVFTNGRASLLQGGDYKPQNNWMDVVKRFVDIDDAQIAQARQAGSQLTTAGSGGFQQVIDAGRKYVDKSSYELFEAYRRAPSPENYDLMVEAVRKFEQYGQQVKQYLQPFKEAALAKNSEAAWKKYYAIRNSTWMQAFDNAVMYNNVNKRIMVANAVGQQVASSLQWTDEFAGGVMKLIGPSGDGLTWQALNEAGEVVKLSDPAAFKAGKVALPPIPESVVSDFQRAIGNSENIVDEVVQDIAKSAPVDSTKDLKLGDTVWRGPNGDVHVPNATPVGEKDGVTLYDIGNGQTVPESELYVFSQGRKLRSIADSEAMMAAQETIGNAPDQIAAAKDALATMRQEWDKVARANKGYLKLENAAGLYVKDGIARVPENKFEDLYGVTIAGQKIENSDDVEALLEEYARMQRQATTGEVAMSAAEAEYKRAQNALELFREQNPYTVNPANPLDLHGAGPGANLYEQAAADTAQSLQKGGASTPTISHLATYQIEQLRKAEQTILAKLPEILGGKPNTLTPGQSVALMDKLRDLIPHYDNAVAMASHAGEEAANFAMLNMGDRRNIDKVLGLIFPYHYFFSRTPKNWAIRTLEHPAIARLWYNSQRAINQENQQANLPTRMQGSIPNPLGIGPERISNPINFMLPYAQYFSDGSEGEDPPTEFERYARPILSQSFPLIQYGVDAALDKIAPLENGKRRTDEYQIGDYVPLARIAGSVNQAMTGQTGRPGFLNTGDQWDPYRNARQVATMGQQGEIAKITGINDKKQNAIVGKYADQIAKNIGEGKPPNTDVPPEMFDMANKVYTEASKQVGYDQARSQIMGWLTGITGHDVQQGEQELRQQSADYGQLGYGPDNPYGSKQAKRDFIDQNPMLSTWWGKNATVPGAEGPSPAASAQNDQKATERDKLYADMNSAVESYLQSHPEASSGEVQKLKAPYYDQISALDKKYPNAAMPEGSGDPTKGMNPAERAQYELDNILRKSGESKPEYPGKDATPQQLKEYYAKLNEFTPQQRASVEQALNGLLAMDETEYPGISQWKSELKKLVGNKYASEIIRYNGVKRASAAEQDWSERMAVVQELTDLQREKAKDRIVKELGQTAYDTMQAYYALPKGSEERKKYEEEHPEVKRSILMAYNPKQYDQAKTLFGQDVWDVYFDKNYPQYPGDNASEADMKAYHDQLDAYNKANPRSEEIRMWVKGRKRPDNMDNGGTVGGTFSLSGIDTHQQIATTPSFYDFGTDWAEAKRIFGPDIFKTVRRFPQTDDKKVIGQYLGAHPELTGYWQWKKDLLEHPERAPQRGITWDVPSQTLRDAVQGQPRPLGSNASPIGATQAPTPTPDLQANNHGIGYGAQTPATPAATPAALPSTTASAAATTGTPATAADGTAMDALDYARQDPKFVKREAINAQIAAQNAAVTKQFGQDTFNLYQQYTDLPKDSDARKQFMKDHPELKGVMAWMYGRSADRDKDSKTPPKYNGGADYEEAKKKFGDHIWDLYGQYNKDWSKAQKKAFFNQHPEYGGFMDWWYGDDGKGEYGPRKQHVYSGRSGEKHGGHKGPRKRRFLWLNGVYGYYDENGTFVPASGDGDGGGKGWYSASGYSNSNNAYVPTKYLDRELQVNEGNPRPWRPDWTSMGLQNAGRELQPGELRPWRAPK